MIRMPVFKPALHVEIVSDEGVFLLSERDHVLLSGALYGALAPLLDGKRTADQVVDALEGAATPAEIYYALARLERNGHVVEADGALPAGQAAFWDGLGLDASHSERRLREMVVSLSRFGATPTERFGSILAALGIQVDEAETVSAVGFAVALTDDYLQPGLADFNVAALAAGRPWLLVKPLGTLIWIGPVFRPGQTGCWECLAQRLRANREVEAYVQHRQQLGASLALSRAALPATVEMALQLAAVETAKVIARGQPDEADGTVLTLDLRTLETRRHTLVRRPQCERCGDGPARPERQLEPLALQSRPKQLTADGGHRVVSPKQTVARFGHHVSPLTGAVSVLTRIPVDDDSTLHVYEAGHNPARGSESLGSLRRALRTSCGGKGVTDAQARASGLCEALERYAGSFQGDEIRTRATYRELGTSAIHPNACLLYSDAQYRHRSEWNARVSRLQRVPEPFDETAEIEWTPVWSLTRQEPRYLPTGYLYYGYGTAPGGQFCWTDSNGNAAGNVLEEAILQGFMELVERDSVATWWYNRVRRPAVDLDSFGDPYIQAVREHYRRRGRDLWVLDVTGDLQVPTFAAIAPRTDQPRGQILLGFGAHLDPRIGIARALGEVNQFYASLPYIEASADDTDDWETRDWWQTATLANQPYLVPADEPPRLRSDYRLAWSDDLREDVLRCQALVERQGLEVLVLDQTRPDIGLPVVKVIVPGLRHIWARLAPGRLYDVPVTLGWLDRPLSEDQLNPIPCFW